MNKCLSASNSYLRRRKSDVLFDHRDTCPALFSHVGCLMTAQKRRLRLSTQQVRCEDEPSMPAIKGRNLWSYSIALFVGKISFRVRISVDPSKRVLMMPCIAINCLFIYFFFFTFSGQKVLYEGNVLRLHAVHAVRCTAA
jgi:hypothetical protein